MIFSWFVRLVIILNIKLVLTGSKPAVGSSTIIIFGQEGKWIPSEDILKQAALGREVRVKLGESCANIFGVL